MSNIQKLDQWASKFTQTYSLSVLKDAVIGVDATYYLDTKLNRVNENNEEPLKAAVGGIPFGFKSSVENDIRIAKEAEIKLVFVFNGLDYVNKTQPSVNSSANARAHEEAWRHYMNSNKDAVASAFGKAGCSLDIMYRHLRKILQAEGVEFLVAPYSATAQLAYMLKAPEQVIDAVLTSTDAFLFDVEKVILEFDTEQQSFTWLGKSVCEDRLNRIPGHVFRDAQLLLGSAFLPSFPGLGRPSSSGTSTISDAVALLNQSGRSVIQLCSQFQDDQLVQQLEYADRYKKAIMTIRHHVVLKSDGSVEPLDFEHAPGDVHEFVGQRLPDELFFYLSRGLVGAEILNWLTSGEINLTLPGGVLDSEPYRRLIIEQLNPVRTQALKVVAESLHYYYSSRVVNVKSWDGRDTSSLRIELKGFPSVRAKASEWKVKAANLPFGADKPPTILACLRCLKDSGFAQKTITKGKVEHPALTSQYEIVANTFWRFLQIRGYVDDKHELTSHGIMLEAVLSTMEKSNNKEALGVVAVEMFRLGLLNTSPVTGATVSPSDKDFAHRSYTILLSKIACIARLRHERQGYSGILDRQLLSFAWMTTAVRNSLRLLIEAVLASMFLNGDVDRDRKDWHELPQQFPFTHDNGAALGNVVQTYLNGFKDAEPTEELRNKMKNQEDKYHYFSHIRGGTLNKSLDAAFGLFDAVYAGVTTTGKDTRDAKTFLDVSEWLAPRR